MNNTIIIYAHPETKGHCYTLLKQFENRLKNRNIHYEILDLYKIKFNPVLTKNEHYTSGNNNVSNQTKEIQKKITEAKNLIFIYPNWWSTMPAIIKGFFDRIFVPGFAFNYVGKIPKGLLTDKKAIVYITTGAPSFHYNFFAGKIPSKLIKNRILKFCGIKSKVFVIPNAKKINIKQINLINKKVFLGLDFLNIINNEKNKY
jgi:NAD(P)H dehydrogenase (quinone)